MAGRLRRLVPAPIRQRYAATFVSVLLVTTLLVGGVGAYTYAHAGDVVERDTREELRSSAEIQARTLDEWLTRMEVQMHAISESAAFQDASSGEVTVYLWEVVQRDDDIDAAYYVDTANDSVLTSVGKADVVTAEAVTRAYGREQFTSIDAGPEGGVVVSKPFRPSPDGAPVLLFVTPIPDHENRAVIAVTDLSAASDAKLHDDEDRRFVVTNTDGTVVMASREGRILTPDDLDSRALDGETGVLSTRLGDDATSTETGYARLARHDWVVTARVPTTQAYALRDDILAQFLAILAAILGGIVVFGVTVGRDTVGQIHTLSAKARALRDGDLDVAVETDREDEFGDLFEAFDVMRRSLGDQIAESEAARALAEEAEREAVREKAESEAFSRHLEETAAEYAQVMAACAAGDLTERIEADTDSEAMATIGDSFNEMMDDVQAQNEQLETVSHVLSHDVRNPLNVAAGRASLLEEDVDSPHTDSLLTALARIEAIIDDAVVLALRNQVEETRPLTLWDAVQRAWGHVETGEATLELDGDVGFAADADLLGHVFENLFANAIDHGGSDVTVRVGPTAGGSGFYVADDGPGIDPAERERVFDTGFTTNRERGGTGFGLAITRTVVEAHGWSITVTDTELGGARFEITGVADAHIDESTQRSIA